MEQPSLNKDIFYEFPPLNLLAKSQPARKSKMAQDIKDQAKMIEKTLMSFGVAAKVINVTQGPSVTRFELQPGPGIKVSSIVNLSQDLALAFGCSRCQGRSPYTGKIRSRN